MANGTEKGFGEVNGGSRRDWVTVPIEEITSVTEQDLAGLQARHDSLRADVARIVEIYNRVSALDEAYDRMKRINLAKMDAMENVGRMNAAEFLRHKISMEKVEDAMRQIVEEKSGLMAELRITARKIADFIGPLKCSLVVGEYEVVYQPDWATLKVVSATGEQFRVTV